LIKQLLAGVAATVLLMSAAYAAEPFDNGWNKAVCTNGVFIPGNPGNPAATPPVPAVPDVVDVYVELAPPEPIPAPPPVPVTGKFSTSDPIAIGLVEPFCISGGAFYFWWDGTKVVYFSIYPNLK
jgi:hypothetical protein